MAKMLNLQNLLLVFAVAISLVTCKNHPTPEAQFQLFLDDIEKEYLEKFGPFEEGFLGLYTTNEEKLAFTKKAYDRLHSFNYLNENYRDKKAVWTKKLKTAEAYAQKIDSTYLLIYLTGIIEIKGINQKKKAKYLNNYFKSLPAYLKSMHPSLHTWSIEKIEKEQAIIQQLFNKFQESKFTDQKLNQIGARIAVPYRKNYQKAFLALKKQAAYLRSLQFEKRKEEEKK